MSALIGKKPIVDVDGNYYAQTKIGKQTWMAENLKTTKYRDGTPIPGGLSNHETWSDDLVTGSYCFWDDEYLGDGKQKYVNSGSSPSNTAKGRHTFGLLYNFYAVYGVTVAAVDPGGNDIIKQKELAPEGWHIPTFNEVYILNNYLTDNGYGYGGSGIDVAKSLADTTGWLPSATAGAPGNDQASNNSTGFSAIPAGRGSIAIVSPHGYTRTFGGTSGHGQYNYWWCSNISSTNSNTGYGWGLVYSQTYIWGLGGYKYANAMSVRCVKDN